MTQEATCPHCSERIAVDVEWTVLRTRTKPPTLADDFDTSATCPECEETFACRVDRPF